MTEDPTRSTARPRDRGAPVHGSVGPVDPHADPATHPGLRVPDPGAPDRPTVPVGPPVTDSPTVPTPTGPTPTGPTPTGAPPARPGLARTRSGVLWTGSILSALVLVVLLIFILQNNVPVEINFLGASGTLPLGVALLFAAVAGLLLVAIPGGLRILQLRRVARRSRSR